MGLMRRGELWYFKKMINGQRFVVSTGFADRSRRSAASDIEHDIRAGVYGWKSTIPSFAEWTTGYQFRDGYLKKSGNSISNRRLRSSASSSSGCQPWWRRGDPTWPSQPPREP